MGDGRVGSKDEALRFVFKMTIIEIAIELTRLESK